MRLHSFEDEVHFGIDAVCTSPSDLLLAMELLTFEAKG